MFAILHALGMFVADLFKSRRRLEAENLFLHHQLAIETNEYQSVDGTEGEFLWSSPSQCCTRDGRPRLRISARLAGVKQANRLRPAIFQFIFAATAFRIGSHRAMSAFSSFAR